MKLRSCVVALAALIASHAAAEEVLDEISWTTLHEAGRLGAGNIGGAEPGELEIRNSNTTAAEQTLFSIEAPRVSRQVYGISGEVRCEAVEGTGYLEMWSHFPDGAAYFSRTLGSSGPMAALTGDSGWRPFLLPFFNSESNPPPVRIVFNVVLPGRGVVHLRGLRLMQYAPGEDPLASGASDGSSDQWWTSSQGGSIGGAFGAFAGIIGALTGLMASRGLARRAVLGAMTALVAIGVCQLVAFVVAVTHSQPYHVWFPLVLGGAIDVAVFGTLIPVAKRRYEALELRRMSALDAR